MSTQKPLLPDRRRVHVPRSQYTHMPAVSGFRAFCALPRDGTIRTTLSLTNKPSFQKGKEMAGCSLICGIERDTFQIFLSLTTFFSEAPSSCVRTHKFSPTVTLNSIVRGIKMSSEISRRDKKGGQFPRLKKRFTIQQTRFGIHVEGYVGHTG